MAKKESNAAILLEGLDETNIDSLLTIYNDVNNVKKTVVEQLEMLTVKIKIILKERKWNSYKDEKTKLSVSLTTLQQERVNKKTLKMLLNDEQYSQVVTKKSEDRLLVINQQDRERLKKYGK